MGIRVVRDKRTGDLYCVWDITYDQSGYPMFLIFRNDCWVRSSAKYFEPYIEEV